MIQISLQVITACFPREMFHIPHPLHPPSTEFHKRGAKGQIRYFFSKKTNKAKFYTQIDGESKKNMTQTGIL